MEVNHQELSAEHRRQFNVHGTMHGVLPMSYERHVDDKNMGEHRPERLNNIWTADKVELQTLNRDWNTCMAKDFLPKYLAGEVTSMQDVCGEQYSAMISKDREVFPTERAYYHVAQE